MDPPTKEIYQTSQVTWQTAFWTLVPLAIAVISQPSGKVCGLPSRYRNYLRISPIFCAVDLLSITAHLLTSTIFFSASPQESLGLLLHERFDDIDVNAGNEGIEGVEKITWLRWLFFILGVLPPTIKMAGFQGIPSTKTWGFLFLTSFLVIEFLVTWAYANQQFFTIFHGGESSGLGTNLSS